MAWSNRRGCRTRPEGANLSRALRVPADRCPGSDAAAGGSAQAAPARRRPYARDGAADDAVRRDRAEVARVVGVRAVVAHHEDRAGAHPHRAEVDAVDRVGIGVGLADLAAVDDEDAVLQAD